MPGLIPAEPVVARSIQAGPPTFVDNRLRLVVPLVELVGSVRAQLRVGTLESESVPGDSAQGGGFFPGEFPEPISVWHMNDISEGILGRVDQALLDRERPIVTTMQVPLQVAVGLGITRVWVDYIIEGEGAELRVELWESQTATTERRQVGYIVDSGDTSGLKQTIMIAQPRVANPSLVFRTLLVTLIPKGSPVTATTITIKQIEYEIAYLVDFLED